MNAPRLGSRCRGTEYSRHWGRSPFPHALRRFADILRLLSPLVSAAVGARRYSPKLAVAARAGGLVLLLLVECVAGAQVPQPDSTFHPGASNGVYALSLQPDGNIVIGGDFTILGGARRSRLGRVREDGSLDPGFDPNVGGFDPKTVSRVSALALQPDGKILVGGQFDTLGGRSQRRIGRLLADGSLDMGFNPVVDDSVNCLTVLPGGKILFGGMFTNVAGQTCNLVGQLGEDGTLDPGFQPGANDPDPIGAVYSLAVQTNGMILAGGSFRKMRSSPRRFLARLSEDGTLDNTFTPDIDSWVFALAVQADQKILVGGWFTNLIGEPRAYIGRLNADGSLDKGFKPNANGEIYSLAIQANGKILVGGAFTLLGGSQRRYLGRLNPDGSLDTTFNVSANEAVQGLGIQTDGKILLGGFFTNVGNVALTSVARLLAVEPATESLTSDGSEVTWMRGGASPEAWRTTFEYSRDGETWTNLGAGTRIDGGWQLTGQVLRPGKIRARGYVSGGKYNGSCWFVESAQPVRYAIVVEVSPVEGGTVTGGGAYEGGSSATVTASPASEYTFLNWTENGDEVSASTNYSFTVQSNRTLVANFKTKPSIFSLATSIYLVDGTNEFVNIVIQKQGGREATVNYLTTTNGVAASSTYGIALPVSSEGLGDFFALYTNITVSAGTTNVVIPLRLVNYPFRREPVLRQFRFVIAGVSGQSEVADPAAADITIDDSLKPSDDSRAQLPPYTRPQTASLQVGMTPEDRGKWRFPWELGFHLASEIVSSLEPGVWPVEFIPSSGYYSPTNIQPNVVPNLGGLPVRVDVQYTSIPTNQQQFGSLRVDLFSPNGFFGNDGRWRLLDDPNDPWRKGGYRLGSILAGKHALVFTNVPNYITPPLRIIDVASGVGLTTVISAYYEAEEPGAQYLQNVRTTSIDLPPYEFCGQLVTDAGYASGILVRPRVVLTAAHALFQLGTTNAVSKVRWFFQKHSGVFEPLPMEAAGWYVSSNYLAARALDPRGVSSAAREFDIAAVYFAQNAGRNGYSGYLAATNIPQQWLYTGYSTIFVGYPLDAAAGKMHDLTQDAAQFEAFVPSAKVFTCSSFGGLPGDSGGPLCIVLGLTDKYPAAIYLGQTGEYALFRLIDSEAAGLIQHAEASAYDGQNHVGGGLPFAISKVQAQTSSQPNLTIIMNQNASDAGIGWSVSDSEDSTIHTGSHDSITLPIPGPYTLQFVATNSTVSLDSLPIAIVSGQALEVLFDYGPLQFASPEVESDGQVHFRLDGPPLIRFEIETSPNLTSWQEFTGALTTNQTGQVEFAIDPKNSQRALFVRARAR